MRELIISILTIIIPLIFKFIYIRVVSYEVDKVIYGNFILLQTLIAGLSYIFLQIPSQAYDRFYNTAKDKISYINEFRSILVIVDILSLIVIFIYGYIINKFSNDILILVYIYFVLLSKYRFDQKIFLLNLERKIYLYIKILESFTSFIMPLIFYFYFHNLESFLIGIILGYFLSFLFLNNYTKRYPFSFNFNINNYKVYFKFAYPIIFSSIFTWGISFSDRYFIEFFIGTKDVAIYSILSQIAGIGQIIGSIYYVYINPLVLKKYESSKKEGIRFLNRMLYKFAFILLFTFLIIYFLPIEIYTIFIPKTLIENNYYYSVFMILSLGILLTVFQTAMSMYFILAKKLNILSYITGIAFVINLIGNYFIKEYGIISAAASTLISYIILNVGQILYIKFYYKELF